MSNWFGTNALRRRPVMLLLAGAGAVGLMTYGAHADTAATWDGSNNNWSSAADWSTNPYDPNDGTPSGAVYDVTIGSGTVTLDVNPTVESLTVGGSATLQTDAGTSLTTGSLNTSGQIYFRSGGVLTVNGAMTDSNLIDVANASTLAITGSVSNSDNIDTGYAGNGGDLVSVSGTVTNTASGSIQMFGGGDVMNVGALDNQGFVDVGSGATLNLTGGGQGITDVSASADLSLYGSFNVINSGVASSAIANLATVEGSVYLRSGLAYDLGSLTNSGGIFVSNGTTVSIAGNLTNNDNIYTSYAGNANNQVTVSGTVTNTLDGNIQLLGAGDVMNVGALDNQGFVNVGGGATLNLTGGGQGITDVPSGADLSLYGNFNVINGGVASSAIANLATVEGSVYLRSGLAYDLGSLTNSGGIFVSNGTTVSIAGNLTNNDNIYTSYAGNGGNLVNVSGTLSNTGSVSVDGEGDIVNVNALNNQGNLYVYGGGTLNITGGGLGVTDVAFGSLYEIESGGAFNVINNGVTTGALAKLASVEGNLYLESGQTYNVGSVTNSGGIYLGNGTTLSITGNLSNTGNLYTGYAGAGDNEINVSGTVSNTGEGAIVLDDSDDVVNINALNNQAELNIAANGATLNLTGGGAGITDVPEGSLISVYGNFNVINDGVSTNALANLASVEGNLYLRNGLTYNFGSITNSGGIFPSNGTTVSIAGSLTNSGDFYTGYAGTGDNLVNISGALTNTATGQIELNSSGDVMNVKSLTSQGHVVLGAGTTLNITGGSDTAYPAGNGAVNVSGTFTNTGSLNTGGTMTVFNTGRVNINAGSVAVGGLSIATGGLVNVNGALFIDYGVGNPSPIATVVSWLQSGYNGGAWNGTTLVSTAASSLNASHNGLLYSVGYADGSDGTGYNKLSSGQIEVLATLAGDANLTGTVQFFDFQVVLTDFGKSNQNWDQGNFDYTGTVDFYDFQVVLSNFGQNNSALTSSERAMLNNFAAKFGEQVESNLSLVSVPEPASCALICISGVLLARRRPTRRV